MALDEKAPKSLISHTELSFIATLRRDPCEFMHDIYIAEMYWHPPYKYLRTSVLVFPVAVLYHKENQKAFVITITTLEAICDGITPTTTF